VQVVSEENEDSLFPESPILYAVNLRRQIPQQFVTESRFWRTSYRTLQHGGVYTHTVALHLPFKFNGLLSDS
jgi:hypothetical protein